MTKPVISKKGVPIRLTGERWTHLIEEHCELAGLRLEVMETIDQPMRILLGNQGKFLAILEIAVGKWLVVV